MKSIDIHSVVALLEDLPDEALVRGQVGTVVENWATGVYEIEFADDNGKTYAMVALKAEQLMRLHYERGCKTDCVIAGFPTNLENP